MSTSFAAVNESFRLARKQNDTLREALCVQPPQNGSIVLTMFAIRRKLDGWMMPAAKGRNGRGGSHMEPCDPSVEPPRLFKTRSAAQSAIRMWTKGRWVASRGRVWSWDGTPDDYEEVTVEPVEGRKAEDLQVVEVQLVICTGLATSA